MENLDGMRVDDALQLVLHKAGFVSMPEMPPPSMEGAQAVAEGLREAFKKDPGIKDAMVFILPTETGYQYQIQTWRETV